MHPLRDAAVIRLSLAPASSMRDNGSGHDLGTALGATPKTDRAPARSRGATLGLATYSSRQAFAAAPRRSSRAPGRTRLFAPPDPRRA